ncbi:hypothetical protein LINGRAHAP2_LOCUS29071 [Linum grandiflorum]
MSVGLCNGTRILVTHLGNNVIRGLIIGDSFEVNIAIITRIVLDKTDPHWPFTLKRRQYPSRLCYVVTINISQGQTLENIGIHLPSPVSVMANCTLLYHLCAHLLVSSSCYIMTSHYHHKVPATSCTMEFSQSYNCILITQFNSSAAYL